MYRPSIKSSLCALLALISTPLVSANSGFQASCADWALSETGYSLTGTCTTANGGKLTTTLDLDKCVANSFGNLVGRVNGGYSASCVDCGEISNGDLQCNCENGSTGYGPFVSYNLNNVVGNANGHLCCFNLCG